MCRMAADSTALVNKQKPGYSSKLERLDELLERLLGEPDRKMILFSEWTGMLDLIQPLLSKREARYVRLDGSVPQKKRQQIVHTFQRDPDCRAIVMTNAGATGLNLQAANTVINVDLPWNPAVLEQRIGRAHRMGQKQPVQVFVLVTEQTIEEGMLRTLSLKHDLALAALDVDSDVDAVHLASNAEDLKRRLEVLLGRKPDAPVDESEKARESQEADRLARREKIATAGGQLLAAGFTLLGELLGTKGAAEPSPAVTEQIKRHAGRLHRARRTGPFEAERVAAGRLSSRPHRRNPLPAGREPLILRGDRPDRRAVQPQPSCDLACVDGRKALQRGI